jgi:hypothetical protein
LGPHDAARRLGVGLSTLRQLRECGLPHHRSGNGRPIYEASEVADWVRHHASRPCRMPRYRAQGHGAQRQGITLQ